MPPDINVLILAMNSNTAMNNNKAVGPTSSSGNNNTVPDTVIPIALASTSDKSGTEALSSGGKRSKLSDEEKAKQKEEKKWRLKREKLGQDNAQ